MSGVRGPMSAAARTWGICYRSLSLTEATLIGSSALGIRWYDIGRS